MSYKQTLDNIANELQTTLEISGGVEIPTEDFGWVNKRYIGDNYRMAHIERYSDNNLEVLHFTCFPNPIYQHPIFGFDIITTDKKPLAAFMDWSPVDNKVSIESRYTFEKPYPLPDWAKLIFSPNALAIVPNDYEMNSLSNNVVESFEIYLDVLNNSKENLSRINYIVEAQNRYCENQQKNERTFSVLKAKLGEDRARHFMNTILFPKVVAE
jgi:phycocyanobilin:ferredoxin oxidoreductase